MSNKQTRIAFTDEERAFLNAQAGQPLDQSVSAATVLLALRQWAAWMLDSDFGNLDDPDEADGLFLPRERGANLRDVTPEQRRENVNHRWQTGNQKTRKKQGELMRAAKKAKRGFRSK